MSEQQLSRRQALKRGAVAGGVLVWTVPMIQAVSMTAAHAESASAPPSKGGSSGGGKSVAGSSSVGGSASSQTGGQAAAGGSGGSLPFTGSAVPATGAAIVGAGLVATGVTATVMSRSRKLRVADGPTDPSVPEADASPEA